MKSNYEKILLVAVILSCFLSACSVTRFSSRKDILEFSRYKEQGNIKTYDSIYKLYYSPGKLFFSVPYRDGEMHGWYEQYDPRGNFQYRDYYVNGQAIDGYKVTYNDSGHISEEGFIKNGHEVGKWYGYFDDGSPFICRIYNKHGKLIKTQKWNHDTMRWEKVNPY